jgi:glycosyltransferase involved in cell wall biosynthesis
LIENELPYELLIYDDCSTDGTINILNEYYQKFPQIIKIHTNKNNIGLYENIQKASKFFNGDIIHFVAGDDLIGNGLIEEIDNQISELKYNPREINFISVPKIKLLNKSEDFSFIKTSANLLQKFPLDYLATTKRMYWQQKGISASMMKFWGDYRIGNKEVGIYSDYIFGVLFCANAPVIVDIPNCYDVHRIGSGVTSKNYDNIFVSYINACKFIFENNASNRFALSSMSLKYIKYEYERGLFTFNKSFARIIIVIWNSLLIILNDKTMCKVIIINLYASFKFKPK